MASNKTLSTELSPSIMHKINSSSSINSPIKASKARLGKKRNYVRDKTFQNVTIKMDRFQLFFDNEMHENAFRNHYYYKSKTVVRICIFGLLLVSLLSFGLDELYYGYSGEIVQLRMIVRACVAVPVTVVWFLFTFRAEGKDLNQSLHGNRAAINRWYANRRCANDYYVVGSICASIITAAILSQTIISAEPDPAVYMLYFFLIYLFVGIPYFFAFTITWITFFAFVISMALIIQDTDTIGHFGTQSFELSAVYLFLTNMLLTVAAYSLERGERREFIHGMELNHQQSIIEGLLNNLLPVHVTDKLRNVSNNDYMIAEQVQECTILFSDMVSFTKWASGQEADVLIQRLHELYACFDDLCLLHRVYKVETIGDAYFVSSNCPIMAPNHADRCLLLGEAMMIECKKLDWAGYTPRMRIGIHTGPVMAGVVGRKMPRYHLFGATVLIAEELESSGKPDYLHISEDTKRLILRTEIWKLEPRGKRDFLHETINMETFLIKVSVDDDTIEGLDKTQLTGSTQTNDINNTDAAETENKQSKLKPKVTS